MIPKRPSGVGLVDRPVPTGKRRTSFGAVVEEEPVRGAADDDHGPKVRPRDGGWDPVDRNAHSGAAEPAETVDEGAGQPPALDAAAGVRATDPRPQSAQAHEGGIARRSAETSGDSGRIAPDACRMNVHTEWDRCSGPGAQRFPHSPVHLGPGEAVGIEQPASVPRPQLDGPSERRTQRRLGPLSGQPGQSDSAHGDARRNPPAHLAAPPAFAQPSGRRHAGDTVGHEPGPALVANDGPTRDLPEHAVDRPNRDLAPNEQELQRRHVPTTFRARRRRLPSL